MSHSCPRGPPRLHLAFKWQISCSSQRDSFSDLPHICKPHQFWGLPTRCRFSRPTFRMSPCCSPAKPLLCCAVCGGEELRGRVGLLQQCKVPAHTFMWLLPTILSLSVHSTPRVRVALVLCLSGVTSGRISQQECKDVQNISMRANGQTYPHIAVLFRVVFLHMRMIPCFWWLHKTLCEYWLSFTLPLF